MGDSTTKAEEITTSRSQGEKSNAKRTADNGRVGRVICAYENMIDLQDASSWLAVLVDFRRKSQAAAAAVAARVTETNILRNHLFGMQEFAIKVGAIQDTVYVDRKTAAAQIELESRNSIFKLIFSEKALETKLSTSTKAITGGVENVLRHIDPAALQSFRIAETDIRREIEIMIAETAKTITALKNGDTFIASLSINKTNEAFVKSLEASLSASTRLDTILRDTVSKGEAVQKQANWLHYLIGGCIGLMILLACGYAHTVSKLLRSKYKELQASNAKAEASQVEIQKINDDVTKLNLELAANLKHLRDAQDELISKGRMEQLGQLTATVAHELRNPLGAVRTSAYLMERKLGANSVVEQQLRRISNGIMRCDNIITQLLDFSRTTKLKCGTGSLDDWLETVIQEEAEKLPAAVTFHCNLQLGQTQVPFDPSRLQRAVVNLLSNATEALVGDGTNAAKFTNTEPKISITTQVIDNEALIEVADNGLGIPLELLEKIREPLFTTKSFGTGLGIPAVEQIAKQHGGALDIASTPGKGAIFTIRLPLVQTVTEALAA